MKFYIMCFLLVPVHSFTMSAGPAHSSLMQNDKRLNELVCSAKKKEVKIDVGDPESIMERHQRRKKSHCCLQASSWACVTCIGLAALCLKLEYGCNCKQP